jgi:hypothetical protein
MSPERLDPVQFGIRDGRPTKESDCYALGMVILEVLSGKVPFTRDCHEFMVMSKVLEGERPGRPQGAEGIWFTDDLWVTLQACWSHQPTGRPTVEAVFECLTRAPMTLLTDFGVINQGHNEEAKTPFTDYSPTTNVDPLKMVIEQQLIPFIISMAKLAEQSSNRGPQFTLVEAENLVDALDMVRSRSMDFHTARLIAGDQVLSSNATNADMRNQCFKILRQVSLAHGILPKSYRPSKVTLSDTIPYASGGFADIWKGQLDGQQVCIKAFRTQAAANLDKIERVRSRVLNTG